MDFPLNNAKAVRVWSDDNNLWLLLVDGRQLSIPIVCFPRLKNATSEQILNYNLSGGGLGVHWDELDEDLYVPNLLLGITSIPIGNILYEKGLIHESFWQIW